MENRQIAQAQAQIDAEQIEGDKAQEIRESLESDLVTTLVIMMECGEFDQIEQFLGWYGFEFENWLKTESAKEYSEHMPAGRRLVIAEAIAAQVDFTFEINSLMGMNT